MREDFDKYLANNKTYISDFDITKHIVLDNESNYWYSAEYVDKMLKKQDKEIERLNNIIEDFEIELQREINVREEDTSLEHNTFIIIQNTLKTALKRLQELKGSDKE